MKNEQLTDRARAERLFEAILKRSMSSNHPAVDADYVDLIAAEFAAIRAPLEAEIERLKGEVASRIEIKYRGRVPSMPYDLEGTC